MSNDAGHKTLRVRETEGQKGGVSMVGTRAEAASVVSEATKSFEILFSLSCEKQHFLQQETALLLLFPHFKSGFSNER